jgi:tritrans,polycis-undecaprenyl-diphosphate synthase [geranylgeranyl-diphosphate specific]
MMSTPRPVPKHIGIIMDGNRRFSKRLMLKPWKGHEWGAEKFEKVIGWCRDLGVAELTVYAFSVQNFERSKEEFDVLMNIFRSSFSKLQERIDAGEEPNMRICFIGRLVLFPADIQQIMQRIMDTTAHCEGFRVNIAVGYGGREEVVDAVKKIGEQIAAGTLSVNDINEKVFEHSLYLDSEPDLVIRTGGDKRTSNFLIWQSHYAEWFFLEKLWPEFEKEDLVAVIDEFSTRERRFGK